MHTVESDTHVTVRPTDSEASICEDNVTCDTLDNLISNNPEVFSNNINVSLEFLQGIHLVQNATSLTVTIAASENLDWYGNREDTKIFCKSNISFLFQNITFLKIRNLKFLNCGHILRHEQVPYDSFQQKGLHVSATVVMIDVISLCLQSVVISHSRGYGLLTFNLRGINSITSSSFLENKSGCDELCPGGSAAFYFYDTTQEQSLEQKVKVTLQITHSKFQDGSDFSCDLHIKPADIEFVYDLRIPVKDYSARILNANEFVVLASQTNYWLEMQVTSTNFSQTDGSSKCYYPAVMIRDNGELPNNTFAFTNCSFDREGTLEIFRYNSLLDDISWNELSLHFQLSIRNCTFTNSSGTALKITATLTAAQYVNAHNILISGCIFTHHLSKRISVVHIKYETDLRQLNSLVTTIEHNRFIFNEIPSLICLMANSERIYLSNNLFLNNFNPHSSAVIIVRAPKYRLSSEGRVHIFKCIFGNNTSTSNLQIKNGFFILHNSTFESSIGTAVYALNSVVHTEGFVSLNENRGGKFGGALNLNNSRLAIKVNSYLLITNNSALYGGGIYAEQSQIKVEGSILLNKNNGSFGGAIYLNRSQVFVKINSYMLITNNHALYGGGIFALAEVTFQNQDRSSVSRCTLSQEEIGHTKSRIEFSGNNATYVGHSVFGGTYSSCRYSCTKGDNCSSPSNTNFFVAMFSNGSRDAEVVIPPTKLCVCKNNGMHIEQLNKCHKTSVSLSAFPGQTVTVPVVAVGELPDKTSKIVVIGIMCRGLPESGSKKVCKKDNKNDIGYGQQLQEVFQKCTNVRYTINSQSDVDIEVKVDYEETPNILFQGEWLVDYNESDGRVLINVKLSQCPPGFLFQESNTNGQPSACKCLSYFTSHNIRCNVNNGTVVKPQNKWIFSGTSLSAVTIPALINRTVVHNSCPYDYCIHEERSVNLSEPDEQCNFNRSGILCGACQTNLSIILGTSNCKKCSNVYLLLIIPFALAGVALVVLLLKCNLTVSVGHINGIIFYANIVQVNKALLFPDQKTASQIFSTFIAWLNLDLGIETCFFQDMDSYTKAWLQFAFPVYLWIMIGLIIVAAHYSSRAGRIIGSNSVPVLATLFLLSYAKLLRTIIAVVSFTFIEFEDKPSVSVWLADGNIKYLSPKHAVLFFAALLFTVLYALPLTLLVLLAPCVQAWSHHKAFRWANRLKPFLDAYQGPYSNKFRYWTGILLIARLVLFVVYAVNFDNNLAVTFFCTIIVTSLLASVLLKKKVYRQTPANWIELFSLLNVFILCSVNWFTNTIGYKDWYPTGEYATYISVAMTMFGSLGIILYQLILKVCPNVFISDKQEKLAEVVVQAKCDLNVNAPTSSVVELANCEKLTEPLLESN